MKITHQMREALQKAGFRMSPEAMRTEIELVKRLKEEKAQRQSEKTR